MKKALIVSIDPGIVTGVSILDSEGKVLSLSSRRDIKRSEIINFLTKFGRPIVIATDVNPPPQSVEKLASALGSKLYFPEHSLSIIEKQKLVKEFSERIKNNHEADSLAAAIKAWKNFREIFSKVNFTLEKLGLLEFFDDVVLKLLKENSDNIDDAIKQVTEEKRRIQPEVKIQKKLTIQEHENLIEQLKNQLRERNKEIISLNRQTNNLNRALTRIKNELKVIEKIKLYSKEFASIKKELEEIKNANVVLRKFEKIGEKGFVPVIEIEKIESSELEKLDKNIGLQNRVIKSNSLENLNFLNEFNIKAFLTKALPEKIEKLEFPIILLENDSTSDSAKNFENFDNVLAVKKDFLENKIKEVRKTGLIEWLKNYRERKE